MREPQIGNKFESVGIDNDDDHAAARLLRKRLVHLEVGVPAGVGQRLELNVARYFAKRHQ